MVRALIAPARGSLEMSELGLSDPGPGEVRIRMAAAGVCHSDLSFLNGTVATAFPVVLGHEASGTVVATGHEVTKVGVGDRVVLNWSPACRTCWFCRHDEPWLCAAGEGNVAVPRGTLADGRTVHASMGVGGFAEEIVVGERAVVPLPDGVPLDVAALLGCAVLTGVGAVRNTAQVRPGQSVVVLGLGGVGLCAVAGARLAGADPIIAVDVAPGKEDLARSAGATHFLPGGEGWSKQVRSLTGGRGADHAFECVGRATTIRATWQATRRGGRCTIVGMGGRDDMVSFGALELYHFARTLSTSVYGSCDPDRDIPILADLIRRKELDLAGMVTHRIGLDGVPEAFDRMQHGVGGRSLVVFEGTDR